MGKTARYRNPSGEIAEWEWECGFYSFPDPLANPRVRMYVCTYVCVLFLHPDALVAFYEFCICASKFPFAGAT